MIIKYGTFAMLDNQQYRTHIICNTFCFFTETMVTRTSHNVMLYLRCLSCYNRDRVCLLRGMYRILNGIQVNFDI